MASGTCFQPRQCTRCHVSRTASDPALDTQGLSGRYYVESEEAVEAHECRAEASYGKSDMSNQTLLHCERVSRLATQTGGCSCASPRTRPGVRSSSRPRLTGSGVHLSLLRVGPGLVIGHRLWVRDGLLTTTHHQHSKRVSNNVWKCHPALAIRLTSSCAQVREPESKVGNSGVTC
jgi:hypothetical protein